jgi:predicted RNase H-like nuclease (RuvC/YqgF family)
VKLDAAITRVKEEKESILQEIMEVEKQILLWEKKIQLERETQDALDPEYGQGEIKGMKKEIHRMKLRLQQLKRQQEKMCAEMERTVYKHDTIKVGYVIGTFKPLPSLFACYSTDKYMCINETVLVHQPKNRNMLQQLY